MQNTENTFMPNSKHSFLDLVLEYRSPWVKSGPLSGVVNKVLLDQAPNHSCTQHLHLLYLSVLCIPEEKSCHRVYVADQVQNVHI